MNDTIVSLIRTWVPVAVGAGIGWVLSLGWFDVSAEHQATVTAAAVGGAISLYYSAARYLEKKWPPFGLLLGVPKEPAYVGTPGPPSVVE